MADPAGIEGALTYDPWTDAAVRFPDWVIRHRPLFGIPEVLCRRRRVILLELGHDRSERRCSLAHALAHLDLDHLSANGWWDARQEAAADRMAARRLMSAQQLADAAVWSANDAELASELGVDMHMLQVRARTLHPAERAYVLGRLDAKVLTA